MSKAGRRNIAAAPSTASGADSFLSPFWVGAGLLAAILVIYGRVWYFDFVSYDDYHYLLDSPYVSNGLTWKGVRWAFTTFYFVNWHPLTWLTYMLDVELYGRNAGGLHVTNVALHAAASLALYHFLRRQTQAGFASALVAALFAVHPLHVESVAWVSERKDVLSGLFFMLTLAAYGAYTRRPGPGRYAAVAALFILGLMSKPMLVTIPFLLLLLDFWPLRRLAEDGETPDAARQTAWRLIVEKIPLLALSAASSVITMEAQKQNLAKLNMLPLSLRVANIANSYLAYAAKTVWPTGLAVFYPYPSRQSGWWMLACLLALALVTVAVVRQRRLRPHLLVGWFWYLGTLVPVIGLVQAGDQAMADRYAYIPIVGLFIMAAWSGEEAISARPERRKPVFAAAAAAVLACLAVAYVQVGYWRDTEALWTRALAVTKDNYVAESGLGTVRLVEGKLAEAIAHYERAVALQPTFVQTYNTLGVTLIRYGYVREAVPYLSRAVALKPTFAEAHSNLGLALSALERSEEAVSHYQEALRLEPDYAEVHANLAITLARQGRLDDAVVHLNEALRLNPDYPDGHYNLAVVLFQKGKRAEAISHLRAVLQLNPGHSDARAMLDDLLRPAPAP